MQTVSGVESTVEEVVGFTKTFGEALGKFSIAIPAELEADVEVPVISGLPQRQGDIGIFPRAPMSEGERQAAFVVPEKGHDVVKSQTGNSHFLHSDGEILYLEKSAGTLEGILEVPAGTVAYLIHTDEHGANGIGEGCYEIRGKQEQQDELRRVAD